MPLTRDSVTAASRIMLPTYVVFFAALGLNYLIADGTASASPALAYIDTLMPLKVWGAVFLCCSALMVVAMLRRGRTLFRFPLRFCALAMIVWAGFIAAASITGNATPLSAAWAAFIAVACLASDRSLAAREV